jgi:hypothetical protein
MTSFSRGDLVAAQDEPVKVEASRDVQGGAAEVSHPHRSVRPLVISWIITLLLEGLLLWVRSVQPVMSEILKPGYVLAALPAALGTWHWFHRRSRHERRSGDRRHDSRRQGEGGA